MSEFRLVREDEWEWDKGQTVYSTRVFPAQATIVWSNRVETSAGPQFGAGTRQTFAQFGDHGPPEGYEPPEALVMALREAISAHLAPREKRGFLARLFGR